MPVEEDLTPAPWDWFEEKQEHVFEGESLWRFGVWNSDHQLPVVCMSPLVSDVADGTQCADMAFIALARNAFDVMMRRGWRIQRSPGGWEVSDWRHWGTFAGFQQTFPDPFTALVEADRWYAANVEAKEKPGAPP